MYKRNSLILILLLSIFILNSGDGGPYAKPQKPNIIYLMADDQRADAFGFMDNEYVITPKLDKLASDGVIFENAYHVAPVCQPSRASVMLGQYLGSHGAGFDQPTNYVITEDEFETSYPVILRSHGYFTGFIGKFGFAVGGEKKIKNKGFENKKEYMPVRHFDVWNGFPGQGSYHFEEGKFNGYENNSKATHLTEFMGDQAIDFLKKAKKSGKPFSLSISFKAPHAPFEPADESRKRYEDKVIPRMVNDSPRYYEKLPEVVKEKSRNARWYFGRTEGYYGESRAYRRDWHIEADSIYQEFIKNYYALITGVDHVVGRIREALKRLGSEDNTVIIYTSDNGFFAGSKQLMGKSLLYEESARAPMVVYDPRTPNNEGVRRAKGLISHVDIAPTLLDIAGVEIPKAYPGKSIMPIVYAKKEKIHEAVYGENNFDNFYPVQSEVKDPDNYQSLRSRYVRTPKYKYIRYHENHPVYEELYKIEEDSMEMTNLINDSDYADVAKNLRRKLDIFEKEYIHY